MPESRKPRAGKHRAAGADLKHTTPVTLQPGEDYHAIFDLIPHPVWIQDFSGIKRAFDELRKAGVSDLRAYLSEHPEEPQRLASLIHLIDMNKAALAHFQVISRAELSSQTPLLSTDDAYQRFREELAVLFEGGTSYATEIAVRQPTGGMGIAALRLAVMPHTQEPFSRVIITFTDVTQQRRIEEEIRDIASFPEENPGPVMRVRRDGTLVYANPSAAELVQTLRIRLGKPVSGNLSVVVNAALAEDVMKYIDVASNQKVYSIMVVPIPARGHVNLYGRDVTLQAKYEEALRRKQEGYRTMVAHAEEPMVLIDLEGKIICVSPKLARALRFEPEEMEGLYAPKLVDTADLVSLTQKFKDFRATAPLPMSDAFRLQRRGGGYIWVTATAIVVNAGEENQRYLMKCEPLEVPASSVRSSWQ